MTARTWLQWFGAAVTSVPEREQPVFTKPWLSIGMMKKKVKIVATMVQLKLHLFLFFNV